MMTRRSNGRFNDFRHRPYNRPFDIKLSELQPIVKTYSINTRHRSFRLQSTIIRLNGVGSASHWHYSFLSSHSLHSL